MKSILGYLRRLARWAAMILAAGSAAAALIGQGGRWNNTLDIPNHFSPLWFACGVAGLVLWLLAGRTGRIVPALAGAGVLVSGLQMAPELLAPRKLAAAAPGAETLKIVQFNVWNRDVDQPTTLRWLLEEDPDIVVIEEALGNPVITQGLRLDYRYRRTCFGGLYCETEIFSKTRPTAGGGLLEGLGIPGAWATYTGKGGPFTILATHQAWPFPAGPQQWQSVALAKVLSGFDRNRLIVTGDFNSTPWSFSLRRQDRMFGLERRTRALASWPARIEPLDARPAPLALLPIDHVYAGQGWRTLSVRRGPRLGSDHYPVIVTLQAAP
jgi:endonuclease/exonuclease/phosphatase (EEP) superfamily protein YafD